MVRQMSPDERLEKMIQRIRQVFLRRQAVTGRAVHRIIQNFDDGDRQVGLPEFVEGMRRYLGTTNDDELLGKAFRHFDSDDSGEISIDEFLSVILGTNSDDKVSRGESTLLEPLDVTAGGVPLNSRQLDLIRRIRSIFIDREATTGRAVHRVLQNFDDGNGLVEFPEFRNGVYSYLGNQGGFSDDDLEEVFGFFDEDGGGTISIDEFLMALMRPLPQVPLAGARIVSARKRQEFATAAPTGPSKYVLSRHKTLPKAVTNMAREEHYVPFYGVTPAREIPNLALSEMPRFSDIANTNVRSPGRDNYNPPTVRQGVLHAFNIRNASPRVRQTLEHTVTARNMGYSARPTPRSQRQIPPPSSALRAAVTPRCPMTARTSIDCHHLLANAGKYLSSSRMTHSSPIGCKLELGAFTPRPPPKGDHGNFRMTPMVSTSHATHRNFRSGSQTARAQSS